MTKLEAVNRVLRDAGSNPVAMLNTTGTDWTALAERELDERERDIQSIGWQYNTVKDAELTPDANGIVSMPDEAFSIDTVGASSYMNVTQQGDHLYDLDNNTDVFTASSLHVTYIRRLTWGCIPEPIQAYIQACASVRFGRLYGRPDMIQSLQQHELRMHARARKFNQSVSDVNILNTPDSIAARGGRRLTVQQYFGGTIG